MSITCIGAVPRYSTPEPNSMDSFKRSEPLKSEQGDELQEYLPQVFDNGDHSSPLPGSIVTL